MASAANDEFDADKLEAGAFDTVAWRDDFEAATDDEVRTLPGRREGKVRAKVEASGFDDLG
jgi:hypothetical protein